MMVRNCMLLTVLLVGNAWAFEAGEKISFGSSPVCKSIESLQVLSKGFGEEDISGTWAQYRKAGECLPGRAYPFVVVIGTHGVLRFGQHIMQIVEFAAQDGESWFVPLADPRQPSM